MHRGLHKNKVVSAEMFRDKTYDACFFPFAAAASTRLPCKSEQRRLPRRCWHKRDFFRVAPHAGGRRSARVRPPCPACGGPACGAPARGFRRGAPLAAAAPAPAAARPPARPRGAAGRWRRPGCCACAVRHRAARARRQRALCRRAAERARRAVHAAQAAGGDGSRRNGGDCAVGGVSNGHTGLGASRV